MLVAIASLSVHFAAAVLADRGYDLQDPHAGKIDGAGRLNFPKALFRF
jgi:hypothetical protein